MALSTNQDMIQRAEKALQRGDMHLAELYLKRSLEMTREERLKTGHPAAQAYYMMDSIKSGLMLLAPVFEQIGQGVSEILGVFKKTFGDFPPSQADFALVN